MSVTRNWHCDICGRHWNETMWPPAELVGISTMMSMKLVTGDSPEANKHACKKCLKKIAEQVRDLSTTDYDFSKLT